jgi:hypothetical protein
MIDSIFVRPSAEDSLKRKIERLALGSAACFGDIM